MVFILTVQFRHLRPKYFRFLQGLGAESGVSREMMFSSGIGVITAFVQLVSSWSCDFKKQAVCS